MGFVEGSGDEFLLTCIVCKNPFGLVAQFCGYCQATRQQALGVERARTNQQIIISENRPLIESSQGETKKEVRKPEQKKVKTQKLFLQNLKIRIDRYVDWQNRFSKPIGILALVIFMCFSYVIIQTYLFVNSTPISKAEQYLYPAITKQDNYFNIGVKEGGKPRGKVFPEKYLRWEGFTADRWNSQASWSGWTGKASITFSPAGNLQNNRPVHLKLKAEYSSHWKVFRKIVWKAEGPAAKLILDYPSDSNLSIYFNGLAAGSTNNPSVPAGTYLMYPGPLEIKFYDLTTGELQDQYTRNFFVSTSGELRTKYRT